jgi:hypothetical protein
MQNSTLVVPSVALQFPVVADIGSGSIVVGDEAMLLAL